jgi:ABC-type multidrug transport system ATPase subunit
MTGVIEVQGLCKKFGPVTAVDHIDLSVPRGQIFGLLGPNAAGKSTTIRLLAGIIIADAGSATLLDLDLKTQTNDIKQRIGYVAQHFALYPELSVAENMAFYSGLYRPLGDADMEGLLATYGLSTFADQRAGTLSGGYKRRLSIACAVSHEPELIFLDEPTAGIDPVTRKELWDLFYDLAASGRTLFVTTHYMEEAERCNQLAFIHQGKLVAQDTPHGIKQSLKGIKVFACRLPYDPALSQKLKAITGVHVLNQFGDELRIVADETLSIRQLEEVINQTLGSDQLVNEAPVNIEDAFMTLTRETPVQ